MRILTYITLALALVNCAQMPNEVSYGLEHGTPYSSPYIALAEDKYATMYPQVDLSGLVYYTVESEDIVPVCGEGAGACIYNRVGIVFIEREPYSQGTLSCLVIAHEMMHKILFETTGDPDKDHSHDNWIDVVKPFCNDLY